MSNLLLDEYPVLIQPSLVRRVGMVEAAIMQQLNYWAQKASRIHDGHSWVYKKYADWSEEIGVSSKACRGALDRLRDKGLVVGIANPTDPHDRTLWWRIDHTVLNPDDRRADRSDREGSSDVTPEAAPSAPGGRSITGASDDGQRLRTENTSEKRAGAQIEDELFAFWQEECKHPQAKFTRERRAAVKARLADNYTARQIAEGIRGAAKNPTITPETGKRWDDLELICRSGSKLEDFIGRAELSSRQNVTPLRGGRRMTQTEESNAMLDQAIAEGKFDHLYGENQAGSA